MRVKLSGMTKVSPVWLVIALVVVLADAARAQNNGAVELAAPPIPIPSLDGPIDFSQSP